MNIGTSEEYQFRFKLYAEKDSEINKWNSEQTSFTLAHNMFSTKTKAESKKYLGFKQPKGFVEIEPTLLDDTNLSTSVDWRTSGGVNAIKD